MAPHGGPGTSERVERGFRYDADGNAEAMWTGAGDPADPDASGVWLLAFDDPENPTETTVTDPLGNLSVYTLAPRSGRSEKPKLATLSGSCPACGLGPGTQLSYEDAIHPYRPTRSADGKGHVTRFAYDVHGRMTSRIDAFGTPLERETTWQYDPGFPAFETVVERPSTQFQYSTRCHLDRVVEAPGTAEEAVTEHPTTATATSRGRGTPTTRVSPILRRPLRLHLRLPRTATRSASP